MEKALLKGRELEDSIDYTLFFRPKDGFVGDVIPYYENGTFYIFYLKDQGDSYNHSIFLVETKDFIHYVDKGLAISSSRNYMDQDDWAGTGSICKVDNIYYFFYTAHNHRLKTQEKIAVAKSEGDLYHFNKIKNYYIEPTQDLSHRDFRDPGVYFDESLNKFILTITTNSPSKGRMIVKYSLNKDLSSYSYEGELLNSNFACFDFNFYNFECSDIFKIGDKWYLSFSCQDDTLWVASSNERLKGFNNPYRLDGKYFYVPKSVSDGKNTYMVGWARSKNNFSDSGNGAWGGNLLVSKINQKEDGTLYLTKIDNLESHFINKVDIPSSVELHGDDIISLNNHFESFILEGDFSFTNSKSFGFVFGLSLDLVCHPRLIINPNIDKIECKSRENKVDAFSRISINKKETHHFTLVVEGSIVALYIDNNNSLVGRLYGNIDSDFGVYSNGNNIKFTNLTLKTR